MRRALFPAILVLLLSTVLGATVFREPIAWAAQTVDATIIGPLDNNGNVKVHEQGTATVAPAPATKFHAGGFSIAENSSATITFSQGRILASLVEVANAEEDVFLVFKDGTTPVLVLGGTNASVNAPGTDGHDLTLTQPIPMDRVEVRCGSNGGNPCKVELNVVGS
jgi:hypothetical protein